MIKLLNIELKKIKSYKIFWVSIVLYTILLPLLFTGLRNINLSSGLKETAFGMVYSFPGLWHNIAYFAGWFNILLYLIMILLVTNEFIFKTFRQNIIDGLSKAEVLFGKLFLGFTFTLYSTLLIIIVGLISNYSFAKDSFTTDLIMKQSSFIGGYFIQTLGYMTFAIFIAFIFKRQGFSIIFFLIYTMMMEPIIGSRLPESVAKYLPLATFSNLIMNPFSRFINGNVQDSPSNTYIILSIVYILVFSGVTLLILEKTDS